MSAPGCPIVVPFVPSSSILARFPSHFAGLATRIGVPGEAIADERASMAEWVLAKTANRSVLGTMNEFAYLAENFRRLNEAVDLLELSLWLAQVPCRRGSGRGSRRRCHRCQARRQPTG